MTSKYNFKYNKMKNFKSFKIQPKGIIWALNKKYINMLNHKLYKEVCSATRCCGLGWF